MLTWRVRKLHKLINTMLCLTILAGSVPVMTGCAPQARRRLSAATAEVRPAQDAKDQQVGPDPQPVPTPSHAMPQAAQSTPQPGADRRVQQASEGQAARGPQPTPSPPTPATPQATPSTLATSSSVRRPVPIELDLSLPPRPPGLSKAQMQPRPSASQVELNAPLAADISLVPGWNLVSIPEEPADTGPAAVLSSIAGNYNLVFAYDGCDDADPWKLYDPADPVGSDLTAIDHRIGFWIEMTAADTLNVSGIQHISTSIQLCQGWNLVGYPLDMPLPVAGALVSIDGSYDRVFAHDSTDPADPWDAYGVAAPNWVNDLQTMEPKRGYWIYATEDVTLDITGPVAPPVVGITEPAEGDELTSPTNITGTASSTTVLSWVLEYRLKGDPTWMIFASGNTSVVNAVLGTLDPTLLLNGIYEIRLTATDVYGQSSAVSVNVVVKGEQKVGNFTVSFIDLDIPVAGLPIQVIRTYDSRDKRSGDFGVGWTLDIRNVRLEENGVTGENWQGTSSGGWLPTYCIQPTKPHIVSITFSDGTVYKFEPVPNPQCQQIVPPQWVTVGFTPLPGTYGTLVPLGGADVFASGSFPGPIELLDLNTFMPYDADRYQLTMQDGRVLVIDQQAGLQSLTDLNGNTLTIASNGIIHSSGKSVIFDRDAQNRITRITDPMGSTINYTYDANGDLVSVTDQGGYTTQFTYNSTHGLLDIIDPRGITPARNEYDDEGRLIAIVDADGNRIEFTHNIGTRQEVVRDRLGNVTVYEYDDNGNVVSQTDALGNRTEYTYDARGNKLSETDALGNTTTYTYDAQDNLLSRTDPLGNRTEYTYNSRGQVLTITDPLGNVTTNTYDANGNLTSMTDPLGNATTFAYDAAGNLASMTDPLGNVTTYAYDAVGNMISQTDPLGNVTTYTYDANGNKLSETTTRTTPSGMETMTTRYVYDGLNRRVQTIDPYGNTTSTEYNAIGKQSATVDKLGNRTEYEYDARGNLTRVTHPDGTEERYTYDVEGRKLTWTDRGGRTISYTYDVLGRLIRMTFPDGTFRETEYDAAGRVVRVIDERGNATRYTYNAAGRRTSITDALGNTTSYEYDANGNQIGMVDANGNDTRFEYDASNRRTRTIFTDGTSTSTTYDALGNRISETDQAGHTTLFEYDAVGRLVKVTNGLGNITSYAYDEIGNLISQTDANGNTTSFEYDNLGRQTRRVLPLGMAETTAYDAAGNVVSRTDFNGDTITFEYDANGRLTRRNLPDGTSEVYTYTATGLRQTVTDSRGVTSYEYDQRDRLTRRTDPDGSSISYTYDAAGNRTSVTIPSGTTTYTFDALNRLATVTDPDGGVTTYTYDAVGNRASVTYPNGTVAEYTYDPLNRLTNLVNRKSTGEIISSYAYTLGSAGNRTRVVESTGRTVDYAYDATYKLTQESINDPVSGSRVIGYTYDPVGNRLTKTDNGATTTYTYDANDRLLTENGTTYTYDDNGNTLTEISATESTSYSYDPLNRLIQANVTDASGSSLVEYVYNVDGIRVQKTVDGADVTNYLVDKNRPFAQVLLETDALGAPIVSYVYGDDLISQKRGISTSYYHYDGQMSTRQLTDLAANVTDTYDYDAFGLLLQQSGSTVNSYLYTGEQYDPNVGFYYLRARYLNPENGRFLSSDTYPGDLFDPPSLHRYLYVTNDPVNQVDPSGRFGTLAGLMTAVSIGQIISAMMPTLITGAIIITGIQLFWKPGFALRNKALNEMASGALGPEGWEAAMKEYRAGCIMIQLGAFFIQVTNEIATIVQMGLGIKDLAKAVLNAPRMTVTAVEVTGYSQFCFTVHDNGMGLLRTASSYRSVTQVRILQARFVNWADAIHKAESLFFQVLHYIQGKTA